MKRSVCSLVAMLLVVGSVISMAQEPEAKPRRKPRGVLPAYYSAVISPDQREKIYAIQQSYAEQLAKLEAELAALKDKRNGEVEAVLTPEQLQKVQALAAEAKAKRDAAKTASEAAKPEVKPAAGS